MILFPGFNIFPPTAVGSSITRASELVTVSRNVSPTRESNFGHCSRRYVSSTSFPRTAGRTSWRICSRRDGLCVRCAISQKANLYRFPTTLIRT